MTEISTRSPGEADLRRRARNGTMPAVEEPFAEAELRLIRILQHRGRMLARSFDEASPIQRLVEAGLVRAVERPGADVILVLSGDGLRLAQSAH